MVVIAGCIIVKDNKVLMVQEAQEKCYGQWNFPAGHVDEPEKITNAAIREVYEETGYKVKLTGVLPIILKIKDDVGQMMHVRFSAEVIEENKKYDTNEILDVQWIEIDKVKQMTRQELRAYDLNIKQLEDFKNNNIYPLDLFDETNV